MHQRYSHDVTPVNLGSDHLSQGGLRRAADHTRRALTESNVDRYSGPLNMGWTRAGPLGRECSGFGPWLGVRGRGPDSALISPLGVGT